MRIFVAVFCIAVSCIAFTVVQASSDSDRFKCPTKPEPMGQQTAVLATATALFSIVPGSPGYLVRVKQTEGEADNYNEITCEKTNVSASIDLSGVTVHYRNYGMLSTTDTSFKQNDCWLTWKTEGQFRYYDPASSNNNTLTWVLGSAFNRYILAALCQPKLPNSYYDYVITLFDDVTPDDISNIEEYVRKHGGPSLEDFELNCPTTTN